MTIQTPDTLRQLCYAHKVAESLSKMLVERDDEVFDPVAYELAIGLSRRIEHAIDTLNVENDALSRAQEEESIHSAAKLAKYAAIAKAKSADSGYALEP